VRIKTVRDLGRLVRDQRKAKGWSQTELALKAGVSRLWIGNLEGGKETSEIVLVFRTLRALDIVLDVSLKKPDPFAELLGRSA